MNSLDTFTVPFWSGKVYFCVFNWSLQTIKNHHVQNSFFIRSVVKSCFIKFKYKCLWLQLLPSVYYVREACFLKLCLVLFILCLLNHRYIVLLWNAGYLLSQFCGSLHWLSQLFKIAMYWLQYLIGAKFCDI